MKTPQVKPDWDYGVYIGNGIVAKHDKEKCDPVNDAIDQAMGNKDCYTEELTPEGIQLVITGAERITEPTETDKQGKLW